ncbi:hypothetical protein BD311DRAFT_762303, partial [Dichomitus squalens]
MRNQLASARRTCMASLAELRSMSDLDKVEMGPESAGDGRTRTHPLRPYNMTTQRLHS